MKTTKLTLFCLVLFSVSAAHGAKKDRPVVCVEVESTENNVAAPIVPEGGIKKLVHEKFQKKEIETINGCRDGYFGIGYRSHGRLEIHVALDGAQAKAGKGFNATTKVIYYEITADGRNEKKFKATATSERVQESDLRTLLKSTVAEKVDECLKNVQASLKERVAR